MPEFANPFTGLNTEAKLTKDEIARLIRFSISAEYEAIQIYMQIAESTDNKLVKKVMMDISEEEKVHAGEFLRLLKEIAPEEEKRYIEGAKEVEEMIEE